MIVNVVILSIVISVSINILGTIYCNRWNYLKRLDTLNYVNKKSIVVDIDSLYKSPENILTTITIIILFILVYLRIGQFNFNYVKYIMLITFYVLNIYIIIKIDQFSKIISILYFIIAFILHIMEFNKMFEHVLGFVILLAISSIIYYTSNGFFYEEDIALCSAIGLSIGIVKTLVFVLYMVMVIVAILFILLVIDKLKNVKVIRISPIMFIGVVLIILTLG